MSSTDGQAPTSPIITVEVRDGATDLNHLSPPRTPQLDSEPGSPLSPPKDQARPSSPEKFLAVPGSRSRGNSVDQAPSSVGGETLVPSTTIETSRQQHVEDDEPLKPDPGNEHEFLVSDNVFAFSPGQLGKLLNPKNRAALKALGGLEGLEKGLRTNSKSGLSIDETTLDGNVTFADATGAPEKDYHLTSNPPQRASTLPTTRPKGDSFVDRLRIFKDNRLPEKKPKSIWRLMYIAFMDKVLLLLSAAAVISLALGLYQTLGVEHDPDEGPSVEWVEGVAIIVAIVIVVVVGAGNDYQKERQFVKLNKKKEDRTVNVIRSGKTIRLSIYDLLVGDVCHLEPGDLIPADGVFISGHNVKCDESSATGESDMMKKTGASDVMAAMIAGKSGVYKLDPFIISGSKVLEGIGTYMVTGVGIYSSHGKTMMALREESEATPLQMKLNDIAEGIAKLGGAAALLLFIVLFIRFLVDLRGSTATPSEKGQTFMQILITAITIVVVAVPEGLPLAVTLALAFATTQMLKDNNLVRVLQACETMGNATTVCSDKTGTLTQNKMTVVAGTIGIAKRFGEKSIVENKDTKGKNAQEEEAADEDIATDVRMSEFASNINQELKELLLQSIVLNSTAFENDDNGEAGFVGSKTETALLGFARNHLGMGPVAEERANADIVQFVPFDSGRKCMGVVVQMTKGHYRMLIKGASEILLSHCERILDLSSPSHLGVSKMAKVQESKLQGTITRYATRSLRTIGLVYRDFDSWPPRGARAVQDDPTQAEFDDVFEDMVWAGVVGIQDPLRDGVREAVEQCQKAGVFVRMVTGDNILTAKAIAEECGIYTPGGLVMEGPRFRQLNETQMDQVIPRLQVLARSSPEDKRILVRRLKTLGETVAVTGDGTNDGPALKMADIGFSMGIAGTEVAKEASSIILMDDNFSSIIKALMWGRAVNDSVKKFLQFQLTVNITAVLLTFVSAVAASDQTSVLSAVQLLWVNLIMDTFAALALATDPPAPSVLDRKPDPKKAPLISTAMWKMIIGQAIYQIVVTFVLNFAGKEILGYGNTPNDEDQLKALVFNTFVWMQIFNQLNNRRLDNKLDIFEGVTRNWFFIAINAIMIGGQVMIIFVGGKAFSVVRLNGVQWAISLILGVLSIPVGIIIRLVPDTVAAKLVPHWFGRKSSEPVYVSNEDRFQWNRGIEEIRQELTFLKLLRGGRLNQLKFRQMDLKESMKENFSHLFRSGSKSDVTSPNGEVPPPSSGSHRRRRSRSNSAFAAAAMVPSIVAGSIGGWSPVERPHSNSDNLPVFNSRADLEAQQGIQVHPDTKSDDTVILDGPPAEGSVPSQQAGMVPATQSTA